MSNSKRVLALTVLLLLGACSSDVTPTPAPSPTGGVSSPTIDSPTAATVLPSAKVPNFDHIVIIIFENWDLEESLSDPLMPNFNKLANDFTLLTQYYGVKHPSLPNYIALMSGETFDITENCTDCFFNVTSLPDLIEASGRTWKTYQEDMPEPCYVGSDGNYEQKHNPFIYFDPVRLDKPRCEISVVPLAALPADIEAGSLSNFIFITPNICNDGHDCTLDVSDKWLDRQLDTLIPALDAEGGSYLVVLMFEEADGDEGCCGLPEDAAGGHLPVVLLSPQVRRNFQDDTPYSHYSLLRTIADAWGLPYLGHAADLETTTILSPWK